MYLGEAGALPGRELLERYLEACLPHSSLL